MLTESEKLKAIKRMRELLPYAWLCDVPNCDGLPHVSRPFKHARGSQVVLDDYITAWITGRGYGKTRSAAEYGKSRMMSDPGHRLIIVAPSFGAARDICVLGESGLMSVIPKSAIKYFNTTYGKLELHNGSQAKIYGCNSLQDAQALRGPQSHTIWFEELAHCRHQIEAFDNGIMGNRLGSDPRVVITSTPRPTAMIRKLFKFQETLGAKFPGLTCRVQGGSTFDNEANLPLPFLAMLKSTYEGTRLGRQELEGLLLMDTLGALLTSDQFRHFEPTNRQEFISCMKRIVIGLDPPGSHRNGAQAGIVVVGLGPDDIIYVIEDASFLATPEQWSAKSVELFHQYGADAIVAEVNYGGDMVSSTMRAAGYPVPRMVHASRGKAVRAEPVVSLYEQRRVVHMGAEGDLADLEQQWCQWIPPGKSETDEHGIETPIPASDWSPDIVDAQVWAIYELVLKPKRATTVMRMS